MKNNVSFKILCCFLKRSPRPKFKMSVSSTTSTGYDIDWIIPSLRSPTKWWTLASTITMAAVGIFSKILIKWLNTTRIYNRHIILKALDERPANVPLVTVSNHHSCFDDPGIWAHDICFTCAPHSYFFAFGKCVPVVRGAGVYQTAVDFCIEQLRKGDWVHIFPEGKVNMTKEDMRFKWGVGRMIFESPITPIVVPVWHIGMDDMLPNDPPYYLRLRKKMTFNYGNPIDFTETVRRLRARNATDVEARKEITDRIQDELYTLKLQTEELHRKMVRPKS